MKKKKKFFMLKEIIVACFLVLLLSAALVNIHYLNKLTDDITQMIEDTAGYAERNEWEKAEKKATEVVEHWSSSDTYTHLVLRHSETEEATNALYALLQEVYTREEGGVKGAAQSAAARLQSISSIERIKLGSIF